jgi:hypothetical protein
MQAVDIAKFLELIDDLMLYNPVPDKPTLETFIPFKSNQPSLMITKQLQSGYLEIVVNTDTINVEYYLADNEDPDGNFSINPPQENSDSVRAKLKPILILDAQSQNRKVSSPLDAFRIETVNQLLSSASEAPNPLNSPPKYPTS